MQISDLSAATAFSGADVLAIEIDGNTYKLTGGALAAALKAIGGYVGAADYPITVSHGGTGGTTTQDARENLRAAARVSIPAPMDAGWAGVYQAVADLEAGEAAVFQCGAEAASLLSGGVFTGSLKGVMTRSSGGVFDILASCGAGDVSGGLAAWQIRGLTGPSATPTVTTPTRYYGGATAALARTAMGVTPLNIGAFGLARLENVTSLDDTGLIGCALVDTSVCSFCPEPTYQYYYVACLGQIQLALAHSKNGPVAFYARYYANGQWYAWRKCALEGVEY